MVIRADVSSRPLPFLIRRHQTSQATKSLISIENSFVCSLNSLANILTYLFQLMLESLLSDHKPIMEWSSFIYGILTMPSLKRSCFVIFVDLLMVTVSKENEGTAQILYKRNYNTDYMESYRNYFEFP